MTETYDVTLAGTGYMVKPGTYQRYQDGQADGRVSRVRLFDFYGGARRANQLERDRFWTGAGAWPTLDSQGVQAGPLRQDKVLTPAAAFDPTAHSFSFHYSGNVYVVNANHLYQMTAAAGAFADFTLVRLLASTVVDCTLSGSTLYFAYGSGTAIGSYDLSTSTYTANVFGSGSNFEARAIGHETTVVYYVRATGFDLELFNSVGTGYGFDSYIRRLVVVDGHLWVLTDRAVWRFEAVGQQVVEASMPLMGAASDCIWAVGHFGKLYTWIGGEVVYYDTTIDSFVGTGVRGETTYGATTVGTWLIVSLQAQITEEYELWGYDGRGWWLLETGTLYEYPLNVTGFVSDADLFAGNGLTSQNCSIWQFFPRTGYPGIRDTFELVTALFDAGERDLDKVWRRAGVELATPDDRATADTVGVELFYSEDGGATWTSIDSQSISSSDGRLVSVGGEISARPTSRWLQLKVTIWSVSAWCPVVVGLWAEAETMDVPLRRRRWKFTAIAADQVVKRDSSVDATGARALATGVWTAWAAGATVAFKDVDYDQNATTYNVRIVGIREIIRDLVTERLASSDLELTLVEV